MKRCTIAFALVFVVAAGAVGCSTPVSAERVAVVAAASPSATPFAVPIATPTGVPYAEDPAMRALVDGTRGVPAAVDSFASPESRAALEHAVSGLDTALASAQAAAMKRSLDAAAIAGHGEVVRAALEEVRGQTVAVASRVLNEETLGADQAVRDAVFLAIVEQQNTSAPTADTPRLLSELVAKTRAAQESQAAFLTAQQAHPSASPSSPGAGGASSGSEIKYVGRSPEELEQMFRDVPIAPAPDSPSSTPAPEPAPCWEAC